MLHLSGHGDARYKCEPQWTCKLRQLLLAVKRWDRGTMVLLLDGWAGMSFFLRTVRLKCSDTGFGNRRLTSNLWFRYGGHCGTCRCSGSCFPAQALQWASIGEAGDSEGASITTVFNDCHWGSKAGGEYRYRTMVQGLLKQGIVCGAGHGRLYFFFLR